MSGRKRKPIINTHCHLVNFKFVPDKMTKLLSGIPEKIADDEWVAVAAGILVNLKPGSEYKRVRKYLEGFRSSIDQVTDNYIIEMKRAGIDICIPLMMDLEQAAPNPGDINTPYYAATGDSQIELISRQAAKYPWQIFPFVMFDPRRPNGDDICIEALGKRGFVGVKMYPALGYHPAWRDMKKTHLKAAKRLQKLYKYCGTNHIPITTHASVGGAYSTKRDKDREKDAWPLTEISNWLDPICTYQLKICFAHFGGNYFEDKDKKRVQSATWKREIENLIAASQKEASFGSIFTDLAYHDMALDKGIRNDYFNNLRKVLRDKNYSSRIIFGTDASMISHTWSEKDYIKPFINNLDAKSQKLIFSTNPVSFLFHNAQIPDSYIKFLKARRGDEPFLSLPAWIRADGDKYYIVT